MTMSNLIETLQFILEGRLHNELIAAFSHHYGVPDNHEKLRVIRAKSYADLGSLATALNTTFSNAVANKHSAGDPESDKSTSIRGSGNESRLERELSKYREKLTGDRPERIKFLQSIGLK